MTQKNREAIARAEGMLWGASCSIEGETAELILDIAEDLSRVLATEASEETAVVHCEDCVLHGNCVTENSFINVRARTRFCCLGMRKEVADDE